MYAPSFDRVSNHAEIRKSPAIHRFEPATTKRECREKTDFRTDITSYAFTTGCLSERRYESNTYVDQNTVRRVFVGVLK